MYRNVQHIIHKILLVTLLLLYPIAQQAYTFRNLTEKDGLSDLMISTLYKDSSGFMWIGTASSVERFDGIHLTHYPINGSNGKLKWVNVIAETPEHTIWVGNDMGLWTVNNLTHQLEPFKPEVINCGVHAIVSTKDCMYIGSERGLFIYKSGTLRQVKMKTDLLQSDYNSIVALNIGNDDRLWILSRNSFYSMNIRNNKMESYPLHKAYVFRTMTRIGNKLYLGTMEHGLLSFDCHSKSFKENIVNVGCNVIMSLSSDGKDLLYIGTDGGGVRFVSTKTMKIVRSFQYTPGSNPEIRSNSVYSLLVDKEGSIWIGYYLMGLDYTLYQSNLFTTYAFLPYFTSLGLAVRAISVSSNEKLIGTRNGLFYINEQKNLFKSFKSPALKSDMILSICPFSNKYLIGTYGGGLSILDPSTMVLSNFTIATDEVFSKGNIFRIKTTPTGYLWIATSSGLYCYKNNQQIYHYTTKNSRLPGDNVYDIYFDSTNKGWICTDNGLCVWDPSIKGLRSDIFPQGFINKDKIRTVYEDSSHKLYFLLSKGGVIVSDLYLNKFESLTDNTPLEGKDVMSIIEDKQGWLWLGTSTGLYRYNRKNLFIPYTFIDGLPSPIFLTCFPVMDASGTIWMGNTKGLVYISPQKKRTKWPYRLAITDVLIDGQKSVYSQLITNGTEYHLKLHPKQRNLTICFSNFIYSDPAYLSYACKMEGIDKDWQPVLGKGEVTYYDLPAGKYVFKIHRMDNPQEDTVMIVTVASSYQALIWTGIILLLVGGCLYYCYRKQIKFIVTKRSNITQEQQKYKKYHISEEECRKLEARLNELMERDKLYTNPTLKIGELASSLQISSNTLSYLFSQYLHKSFYDYLNTYRIEAFQKMINEDTTGKYTLVAIAELCGFNSRASFFRYFKKVTGITPNQYMQSIGKGNIK